MKNNARERMRLLAQDMGIGSQEPETQKEEKPEKQEERKPALRTARGGKADSPVRAKRGPARVEPAGEDDEQESATLEQMTIKLEPEVRNRILGEVFRRKTQKLPNRSI